MNYNPSINANLIQSPPPIENNISSTSLDNNVNFDSRFDVIINQKLAQADPTANVPIEFDVVFSSPISSGTLTTSDFIQNGTATGITWNLINSGDDTNFTLQATAIVGEGTVTPSLAEGSVQNDLGGYNRDSTSSDGEVTYRTTIDVTVDQGIAQIDPTDTLPIWFEVKFTEPIDPTTFTTTDITQNGSASVDSWNIINSGDSKSFYLEVSAISVAGNVQPSISTNLISTSDGALNNASTSVDNDVIYQPTFDVTINQKRTQTDPTASVPIEFDVIFSEAIDTSTFDTSDIIQISTASGITWNIINSGDDRNFTLQATAVLGEGIVKPTLAPGSVNTTSLKSNNTPIATDDEVTYDGSFTVTIEQKLARADPTNALPIEFDVVFEEAIDPTTFTSADITQNGTATVDSWNIVNSGDNINFTLQATAISADGTVTPFSKRIHCSNSKW